MKIFHRHDWENVRAKPMEKVFTFSRGPRVGETVVTGHVTEVLQRCACRDVRTKTLDGLWTIEDINHDHDCQAAGA